MRSLSEPHKRRIKEASDRLQEERAVGRLIRLFDPAMFAQLLVEVHQAQNISTPLLEEFRQIFERRAAGISNRQSANQSMVLGAPIRASQPNIEEQKRNRPPITGLDNIR